MKIQYFSVSIVFFLLISVISSAQPLLQWNETLVGSSEDFGLKIVETNDGNFVFTGTIQSKDGDFSETIGKSDLWIIKMDESGEVIWKKNHSIVDRHVRAFDIKITQDGGYIITATKTLLWSDDEIWIVKLDETANIEWEYTKVAKYYSSPRSIVQTADGNFVIGGSSVQSTLNYYEHWVFKLDNAGELIWELGQEEIERVSIVKILETDEQNLLAIGTTKLDDLIWLRKLDKDGNLLWEKTYNYDNSQAAIDGIIASDGSILICGHRFSNVPNFLILKIDSNGSVVWEKTLGGSEMDYASSISETSNGDFLIAGRSDSDDGDVGHNMGGSDVWVVKLDTDGQLLWSIIYGGIESERCNSIYSLDDGFIAAGSIRDSETARLNCHIIKYSSDISYISNSQNSNLPVEIFPNPSNGTLNISSGFNGTHLLEIFNLKGQMVFSKSVMTGNSISLEILESGIYEAKIQNREGITIQKLIITK